ncbi:MAG: signal peptidase I [Anaerolineales bacterium]|nr:signal peptidase I [Anaerolineales bacterium]
MTLQDIEPREIQEQPLPASRPVLDVLMEIIQTLLLAGALFLAVNVLSARIRVEGPSMENSLVDGEVVIVNRLAYRWNEPQRGDIIVFRYPLDPDRRLIKRIVGIPGDEIHIAGSQVYINGSLIEEPYLSPGRERNIADPASAVTWTLEEDQVFVMGDNREHSSDSRHWGPLPSSAIIGKAVFVYWPVSQIGAIPHYDTAIP